MNWRTNNVKDKKRNNFGLAIQDRGKWRMWGIGCYSESYAKKIFAALIRESDKINGKGRMRVMSASSKEGQSS